MTELNQAKDKNYFIRRDYRVNPVLTFNKDDEERYWTGARVANSSLFQYHVYLFAHDIFLANKFSSLVDVGCGPGTKAKLFFAGKCNDITLIDQPSIETTVNRLFPEAQFVPANLEIVPIETSRKFQMVICSDVIEHLSDPDKLVINLKSLMTNDSLGIISTPDRELRRGPDSLRSPNKQHVREWDKKELREYLEFHGLNVVSQLNLPIKKMGFFQNLLYRISQPLGKWNKSEWYGNQVVLFRLK